MLAWWEICSGAYQSVAISILNNWGDVGALYRQGKLGLCIYSNHPDTAHRADTLFVTSIYFLFFP